MKRWLWRLAAMAFLACLLCVGALAQNSESGSAQPSAEQSNTAEGSSAGDANAGGGAILSHTTQKAAHTAEQWGEKLGLGPRTSFLVSLAFNFAGIAVIVYVLLKSKLPQALRDRTTSIQKGIKDAQLASADAARRLSDIESRLSKLDGEIAEIRASAEREAEAEEERIRQAAEADKQKVVQAAEAEIDAIARNARRELKGYAASLAVDLAGRKIRIDDSTDHALVREFVDQLGKDGK